MKDGSRKRETVAVCFILQVFVLSLHLFNMTLVYMNDKISLTLINLLHCARLLQRSLFLFILFMHYRSVYAIYYCNVTVRIVSYFQNK